MSFGVHMCDRRCFPPLTLASFILFVPLNHSVSSHMKSPHLCGQQMRLTLVLESQPGVFGVIELSPLYAPFPFCEVEGGFSPSTVSIFCLSRVISFFSSSLLFIPYFFFATVAIVLHLPLLNSLCAPHLPYSTPLECLPLQYLCPYFAFCLCVLAEQSKHMES